ncbi:hypothetical protein [Blastococcus montanus]|uniref:hypothetical protein n=1 Tax=Blastococcus montanus TaxID=3144973 RepID=UPI003207A324
MTDVPVGCRWPPAWGRNWGGRRRTSPGRSATSASWRRSPRLLVALAQRTPLLPGADFGAFLDLDDTIRETHGYAKQGVGYGYSKVKGLNALLAVVSTARAAPLIVATRLRKGSVHSCRGAPRMIADALTTARKAGATGAVTVRADSAFYNRDVVAAASAAGRPSRSPPGWTPRSPVKTSTQLSSGRSRTDLTAAKVYRFDGYSRDGVDLDGKPDLVPHPGRAAPIRVGARRPGGCAGLSAPGGPCRCRRAH